MPSPSTVVEMFDNEASYKGIDKACDFLCKLGFDSLYLRGKDFEKNIVWQHDSQRGKIIVTINLSKPEKLPNRSDLQKKRKRAILNVCFAKICWVLSAMRLCLQDKTSA